MLTINHGGGYVAKVHLSYTVGGKTVTAINRDFVTAGYRQAVQIPADATNIVLDIREDTGTLEGWRAVFVRTWPSTPTECIKIYGTTLDQKWNNECS